MQRVLISVLLFCLTVSSGYACELDEQLRTQGCPQDVADLSDRLLLCIHWGGEDAGGDKKRAEEIYRGWASEDCHTFQCDAQALVKKYKKDPGAKAAVADMNTIFIETFDNETGNTCQKS